MMSVAFKEGIKIKPEALNDLIVSCNYDIRQVRNFNYLLLLLLLLLLLFCLGVAQYVNASSWSG